MGTADQHQETEATADKRRYTQIKIYEQELTMRLPDLVQALSASIGVHRRLKSGLAGGGNRDRTGDLLHAMQALSQLSYTPTREREL